MPDTTAPRYAIYYAPLPDTPWWQAGSTWLGRCAATGQALAQPTVQGLSAEVQHTLTAAPRRYGWHATLKAPFSLTPGTGLEALEAAVEALSNATKAFELPPLGVQLLDDFLALVPKEDAMPAAHHALNALAQASVQALAPWAAPLSAADMQRRRKAPLTPRQDALLLRWGYPYVLDEFRFHCSLSGSLTHVAPLEVQALLQAAQTTFGQLPPCHFEALALFVEPSPGTDFRLLRHFRLRA